MFRHVIVSRRGQPAIYDAVADGVGHCQAEVRDAPFGNLSIALSCARSQSCISDRRERAYQRRNCRQPQNVFVLTLEWRLSMAMCTVAQTGVNAPCHCYMRFRALTASRVWPATTPKKLLQTYCKSCMLCPAQRVFSFAAPHETFQAGSRQQPHSTQRPNRRVEHHMNTLPHRDMVAFFAQ